MAKGNYKVATIGTRGEGFYAKLVHEVSSGVAVSGLGTTPAPYAKKFYLALEILAKPAVELEGQVFDIDPDNFDQVVSPFIADDGTEIECTWLYPKR